jgi:hypothetical protein
MQTSRGATEAVSLGFQPKVTNASQHASSRGATTAAPESKPVAASRLVRFGVAAQNLGLKPEAIHCHRSAVELSNHPDKVAERRQPPPNRNLSPLRGLSGSVLSLETSG